MTAVAVAMSVSAPCFAGQVQLQLEPSALQVGQTGHLTVYMVGGKTLTAPEIPEVDGLLFEFDRSFQRFAQSGFSNTLVVGYRFRVTATQEGSFTLGPWDFPFKNQEVVRAEPVVLRVKARSESESEADITAFAGFGTDKAWEGQVVVYSYQLEAHVPILNADWRIPDFQGLTAPHHGQAIRLDYDVDDVDGRIMYRGGAMPLVVTGTGQQNHGAALVSVRLAATEPRSRSRFYNPKVVQGVTDPAPLTVTSLPNPPDNFSGLVGDFRFQSQLDRAQAPVGASVAWTLDVVGNGELAGWHAPTFDASLPVSIYDGDVDNRAQVNDGKYHAAATINRVVVPSKSGVLKLPKLDVVTFSPTTGTYVTHSISTRSLNVSGADEDATDIESFAGSPAPLVSEEQGIDFRDNYRWGIGQFPSLAAFAPAIGFVLAGPSVWGWWILLVTRIRDARARRREASLRPPTAVEQLAALPSDPGQRLAALDGLLRLALAVREDVSVNELDRAAAIAKLPDELAERAAALVQRLDRARFADGPPPALAADVEQLIRDLEQAQ